MFGQGFNYGFLGKPLCFTDTTDIFKDNSGVALYTLDYDASDSGNATGKFGEAAIFNGSSSVVTINSPFDMPDISVSFREMRLLNTRGESSTPKTISSPFDMPDPYSQGR